MSSNTIVPHASSSSHAFNRYDVFVSFRGEDTRNNFTSFLFGELRRKGIVAFKDDEDLKKGESIAPELLQAIQGSRLFVVVFSKNYASSTWCLRELAEILNCAGAETWKRTVIPIFYDVDTSVVRKQSECYEKAFAEHEKRFREDGEKMEETRRWREALGKVADCSGWDIRNKPQNVLIEEIVEGIRNALDSTISSLPKEELVGIESPIEELTNRLHFESVNDVRVVGICGMGGIGKSTLARALYERIRDRYQFDCFIDDVSKLYRESSSLGVQKQLICQSLKEKNLEICNAVEGTRLVWSRLQNARALVILDNVDDVEQLRIFTGNRDTLLRECLGGGSRIIIISRDRHILTTHGVNDVYPVQPLRWDDAMKLFGKFALRVNHILSDYEKLAPEVLSHAGGHPLAIKVIGSSLNGQDVSYWRSELDRLRYNKKGTIMDLLRISVDQLEQENKEIFLDIACFLHDKDENYVKEMLDIRGFHPDCGLKDLADKSLITYEYGNINMHGLLIDLGWRIVREKSPKEPIKWSRLWDYEDLERAMLDNEATENLEVVCVEEEEPYYETTIRSDGLSKIRYLKVLKLQYVNFTGSLSHLSSELGYLDWFEYPFECLPPSFQPQNLVELHLRESRIKRLWEGTKPLPNLKYLDLSFSENLVEMPDVGEALKLETILLEGCVQLRKVNPSIGRLSKLAILNLADCKNLVSLPNIILGLTSLECLNVSGCSQLYKNELISVDAPIDSFGCSLAPSPTLPRLRRLNLSFCNLVRIPDAIGNLSCLEYLDLKGNNFATLPNLKNLSSLYYLDLQHCKGLSCLPELPSRTELTSKIDKRLKGLPELPSEIDLLPTFKAGLMIFNCPELVERERCTDLTVSWMIQIVQEAHQAGCLRPYRVRPSVESIIPGSEIPRGFNHQFVGMSNSIKIDPYTVKHDKNWIGVACCIIFRIGNESVKSQPYYCSPTRPPVYLESDLEIMDQSDHMWLFYLSRESFYEIAVQDIQYYYGEKSIEVEVKKYGYRWVYEQDGNLTAREHRMKRRRLE